MVQCASVRKKGSTEQCTVNALKGLVLCGRHARCKHAVLWAALHEKQHSKIAKIQALARGWLLRRRLYIAGPSVLTRKSLTNDEDLETCEEASKEDPFTYFSFEERGKIWWFHFPTLWKWSMRLMEPTNPYTKVPLSIDTRKRMRAMWSYNFRHKLSLPKEADNYAERLHMRCHIVCQIFEECGFGNVHPHTFLHMRKNEFQTMFRLLKDDIAIVFPETSRVRRFVNHHCTKMIQQAYGCQPNIYILYSVYVLSTMLVYPKDPYILAFTTLSAVYRS